MPEPRCIVEKYKAKQVIKISCAGQKGRELLEAAKTGFLLERATQCLQCFNERGRAVQGQGGRYCGYITTKRGQQKPVSHRDNWICLDSFCCYTKGNYRALAGQWLYERVLPPDMSTGNCSQ